MFFCSWCRSWAILAPRGRPKCSKKTQKVDFGRILYHVGVNVGRISSAFSARRLSETTSSSIVARVSAISSACVACSRAWNLGGWNNVIKDIQPDRHRSGPPVDDSSEGKANYLFADGHVQLVDARLVKTMIEDGLNPAKPSSFKF